MEKAERRRMVDEIVKSEKMAEEKRRRREQLAELDAIDGVEEKLRSLFLQLMMDLTLVCGDEGMTKEQVRQRATSWFELVMKSLDDPGTLPPSTGAALIRMMILSSEDEYGAFLARVLDVDGDAETVAIAAATAADSEAGRVIAPGEPNGA